MSAPSSSRSATTAALYTREFYDSPYNSENAFGPTYGTHREALEFGEAEYRELKQFAESLDLVFFATAFDFAERRFPGALGVPCYKVASGDMTNIPLLQVHRADRQADDRQHRGRRRLDDVRRAYDAVHADQPAGRHPPLHGGVPDPTTRT